MAMHFTQSDSLSKHVCIKVGFGWDILIKVYQNALPLFLLLAGNSA